MDYDEGLAGDYDGGDGEQNYDALYTEAPLIDEEAEDDKQSEEGKEGKEGEDEDEADGIVVHDAVITHAPHVTYIRGADRITRPIMTIYEYTRLISSRAEAIANNSPAMVEPISTNAIEIAIQELKAGKMPLYILRPMPGRGSEVWHSRELQLPRE